MSSTPSAPVSGHPFEGLYAFVSQHLVIVNSVLVACGTLVGALDFMAPRLALLPRLLYSCTALLALAMIAAALAPTLAARLWAATGRAWPWRGGPMWRRPGWQFGVALLIGVSVLGFASVAKASQGGWIASAIPAARALQEDLLSIRAEVSDIKLGVGEANTKLDRIALAVDPSNAADRCADLDCAVSNGASPEAVERIFSKGAQIPGGPIPQGALLLAAALSPGAGRLEVIDLLVRKGLDLDLLIPPVLSDPATLTKQGRRAVADIQQAANFAANPLAKHGQAGGNAAAKDLEAWNAVSFCFLRTSGGVSLVELAALLGDSELTAHLRARGAKPPERPLACQWKFGHAEGFARVEIDAAGKYAGVAVR
ncbi:hypothetical protein [Paucibacter sp. KBW04]|uniref:hypothetical protein n=1 Tax=Paucibacter sp. KBW04 TaxID=2153361 RepID=UPI000F58B958|nr:hypothetical protein [Paucibacter sp. KBW04]